MKRALTAILLATLLITALTEIQVTSWVNANFLPSPPISTIYIKSDGSIQPSTAPIQRIGNIYSILSDLPNSTIEVQCDNLVIDGKGFTISGHGVHWHTGITLSGRIGVTIKNIHIRSFGLDIKMDNAAQNTIIGNHIEATMDGVSMINSNNNNISGNWISGVTYGVHGSGSFNKIIGNNFTGNTYSVRFYGNRNKISDNFFQDQTSIFLTGEKGSHYNTISGNTMSGSKDGVYLLASSTNNVVFGNNITGKQEHGIYITECQNNTIYGNHIASNHVGIQIGFDPSLLERYPSINNLFHHNNLVGNGENVRIERAKDGSLPSNCWDNGNEGNYWSDYQGIDANNDSIGDDFYVIDENNQDRYPLMNPINKNISTSSLSLLFPPYSLPVPPSPIRLYTVGNRTYDYANVTLTFSVNPDQVVPSKCKIAYSLDGQANVTLEDIAWMKGSNGLHYGYIRLYGLPDGAHNVTAYLWDPAGNVAISETVIFNVNIYVYEAMPAERTMVYPQTTSKTSNEVLIKVDTAPPIPNTQEKERHVLIVESKPGGSVIVQSSNINNGNPYSVGPGEEQSWSVPHGTVVTLKAADFAPYLDFRGWAGPYWYWEPGGPSTYDNPEVIIVESNSKVKGFFADPSAANNVRVVLQPVWKIIGQNSLAIIFTVENDRAPYTIMAEIYGVRLYVDGKPMGDIEFSSSAIDPGHVHRFNTTLPLSRLSDGNHSFFVLANTDFYTPHPHPIDPGTISDGSGVSDMAYFTVDTVSPGVSILSPVAKAYRTSAVVLSFYLNEHVSKTVYSLDGGDNVTFAGNMTLSGLSIGAHSLTLYAWDREGNIGTSVPIFFTVVEPEAFPTSLITAILVLLSFVALGFGLVAYFVRRNRRRNK